METLESARCIITVKDVMDKHKEYHIFRDHISYITTGSNHTNRNEFTIHLMNGDKIQQVEEGGYQMFVRKIFDEQNYTV